jgi:hypothetical protein
MSTRVTVTLSDEVYQRAERLAQITGRKVSDVLADTIEISLPPLGGPTASERTVAAMTDEEVLDLADLRMAPAQDQRLSELLYKQQAGQLADSEPSELAALMRQYEEGLLRKAQALQEAVKRGLREPFQG